jgi:hypothetical protein
MESLCLVAWFKGVVGMVAIGPKVLKVDTHSLTVRHLIVLKLPALLCQGEPDDWMKLQFHLK